MRTTVMTARRTYVTKIVSADNSAGKTRYSVRKLAVLLGAPNNTNGYAEWWHHALTCQKIVSAEKTHYSVRKLADTSVVLLQ